MAVMFGQGILLDGRQIEACECALNPFTSFTLFWSGVAKITPI